jgi:hypothetical protein
MSNATYLEVASQDPSTLANTLYSRDFAKSTDLAVATTLLANLGLASQAGLDAWVAAQLTAAGAANKGAKIVSLLNDFAGLASDATWGTYATAFNTKVDAALAASQKTGSVEAKFEAAGVVAVADATFTLTTGIDKVTGGAGADTVVATTATMSANDSADGGDGVDTLTITQADAVAALAGTYTNIENLVVKSDAAVGGASVAAVTASAATYTITTPGGTTGSVTLTVGAQDVIYTGSATAATAATNAAAAIVASLTSQGYTVVTSGTPTATEVKVARSSDVITVTGLTSGAALPVITAKAAAAGADYPAITSVAGKAAVTASVGSVLSATKFATDVNVTAGTEAGVSAAATANVTVKATAGAASVVGGNDVTASGKGSVVVTDAAGNVKVTVTSLASGATTVNSGKAVTVTAAATKLNTDANAVSGSLATGTVTIGTAPVAGTNPTTTTGYPQVITDVIDNPTGDVTVNYSTTFTTQAGQFTRAFGNGAVNVYTNGAKNVSVTGGATATITDVQTTKLSATSASTAVAGTSTLNNVTINGTTGAVGITSNALDTLKVVNTASAGSTAVTVTNATTAGHSLALTVGNATATVTDDTATSVTVTTEAQTESTAAGASASTLTLNAAKATTLTFSNSLKVTNVAGTTGKITSIVANGSGALDLVAIQAATGTVDKLTSIDASAATGAVSMELTRTIAGASTDHSLTVTTGSGADTIKLNHELKGGTNSTSGALVSNTVNLGAGNDFFLNNNAGTSAISAGASVDGGDGTDVISANLVTVGNSQIIKNFEGYDIGALGASAATYDGSLLGANTTKVTVKTAMNNTAAITVTNLKTGGDLTVSARDATDGTQAGKVVLTLADATATDDNFTLNFAASASSSATAGAGVSSGLTSVTTSGLEKVTISSAGTAKTSAGNFINNELDSLNDTANTIASIVITGGNDFKLNDFDAVTATQSTTPTADIASALKLIDGSAATGNLTISAGTTTDDVSGTNFDVKYTGLKIVGGSGNDTLTINAKNGVVDGGAGNDTLIAAQGTNATLTGGEGKDTFDVSSAKQGASGDSATSSTATINAVTIADFAVGDTLKVGSTSLSSATIVNGTTAVASATSLFTAIEAALTASTVGTDVAVWFKYGSDTYIAIETGSTNGFTDGDIVVKLTGTHVLTAAAVATPATGLFGEA